MAKRIFIAAVSKALMLFVAVPVPVKAFLLITPLLTMAGPVILPAAIQSPVSLQADLGPAMTAWGQQLILTVTIRSGIDLAPVAIRIVPPPGVVADGEVDWRLALSADQPVTLRTEVRVEQPGYHVIRIEAAWGNAPVTGSVRGDLTLVATPAGIEWSREPVIQERLRRGELRREGMAVLLDEPLLPDEGRLEPLSQVQRRYFRRLLASLSSRAPSGFTLFPRDEPEAALKAPREVTINGSVRYQDSAGVKHPARLVAVEIVDQNGVGGIERVARRTTTRADGTFIAQVRLRDPDGSGADLKVRVLSWLGLEAGGEVTPFVATVGPEAGSYYLMESPVYRDVTGLTLKARVVTPRPVAGSTTDADTPRIFSLLDACLEGALQTAGLKGSGWLGNEPLQLIMPAPADACDGAPACFIDAQRTIYFPRYLALAWDAILHEYFHFVTWTNKTPIIGFQQIIQHEPAWGSAIGLAGMTKGNALYFSWSEALATFLAVGVQKDPVSPTNRPAIPLSGDVNFDLAEDGSYPVNLETLAGLDREGYASEASVVATLWDLHDKHDDSAGGDGGPPETVSMSIKNMWTHMNAGTSIEVTEFAADVLNQSQAPAAGQQRFGQVLTRNWITPAPKEPANGAVVSWFTPPHFTWEPQGDPNPVYANNGFVLNIYSDDFSRVLLTSDLLDKPEFQPKADAWRRMIRKEGRLATYRWLVRGMNDEEPRNPPGTFLAGCAHSFTLDDRFEPPDIIVDMFYENVGVTVNLTQNGETSVWPMLPGLNMFYSSVPFFTDRPTYGTVQWQGRSFSYQFSGDSPAMQGEALFTSGGGYVICPDDCSRYQLSITGTLDDDRNLLSATVNLTVDNFYDWQTGNCSSQSQGNLEHIDYSLGHLPMEIIVDYWGNTRYRYKLTKANVLSALTGAIHASWNSVYPDDNGSSTFISADWANAIGDMVGYIDFWFVSQPPAVSPPPRRR